MRINFAELHPNCIVNKRGESALLVVTTVDVTACKATFAPYDAHRGVIVEEESKSLSKSTIERWYETNGQTLSEDITHETTNTTSTTNEDCADCTLPESYSDGEVKAVESNEIESEPLAAHTNEPQTTSAAGAELNRCALESESIQSDDDPEMGDDSGECDGSTDRDGSEISGTVAVDRVGSVESDTECIDNERVDAPIQPANTKRAGVASNRRNAREQDAGIARIRSELLTRCNALSTSVTFRETGAYVAIKDKHNFAEVHNGKRQFSVVVMSAALTPEQANKCAIAPANYGWTLDAKFTIYSDEDAQLAYDIIKASWIYRLTNPPTRGRRS